MFAGAAFTDQADIKATDAVNMLSALGVINGYDDGSYKPDATVTRAEMAKMIFVVRNNKIDDSAYKNNSTKLTDVNNHWAAGYIKFCESQGIIAGKGNNKFDPDATVTGVEAAKMLLVVSGYDAQKAGLTGSAWQTNVLKYAGAAGILDDVNSALESGLPRQYAAQMIYNTLDVNRVKWSEDSKSFDDVLNGGVKETVGKAYMGLSYDYGTLTEIDTDSLTIKLDSDYDSDNYHNSDRNYKGGDKVSFTKVGEDYTALLGQKVKVMFKDGKTNNVLGVYSISDNKVYTTRMNKVELDGQKIKFGGTSYSVDNTKKIDLTFIGVNGTKNETVGIAYFDKDGAQNDDKSNGVTSLSEVTFVDTDGNNKIDTALVIEKVAGEVTNVASDKITFAGKTYKFADEQIDETLVADDYAVMSANLYKDCKNIVKADVVTAVADGQKDKTSDSQKTASNTTGAYTQYKVDGNWYNTSKEVADDAGISTGDKVKVYVANGVAVKIKTDDGNNGFPTNIAVAVGTSGGSSLNGDQVRVRYFDGTIKTLTMSSKSVTPKLGVSYKITGSDSDAKLEYLADNKEYNGYKATLVSNADDSTVKTGTAKPGADDAINGVKVDDKAAVILYTSTGRSKLITGKQYKALSDGDVTNSTAVFTKKSNGLERVQMAAVLVSDIDASGNSSDNYAYIVSAAYENDGNLYYTIWNGSENIDVVEKNNTTTADRKKGVLLGYSGITSDKEITDVTDYGTISGATQVTSSTNMDNSTRYMGGNESTDTKYITVAGRQFNITADTTVLRVDSDADDSDEIGQAYTYGTTAMTKAQKKSVNPDVYTTNVWFIMDETAGTGDDKDIDVLVIDSTGAFKGHKVADTNNGTTVTDGTYVSGDASVKVANTDDVTGMAAIYNTKAGTMTVQLTVASGKTVDADKLVVKVGNVTMTKDTDYTVNGTTGTVTIVVNTDAGNKVSVEVPAAAIS